MSLATSVDIDLISPHVLGSGGGGAGSTAGTVNANLRFDLLTSPPEIKKLAYASFFRAVRKALSQSEFRNTMFSLFIYEHHVLCKQFTLNF